MKPSSRTTANNTSKNNNNNNNNNTTTNNNTNNNNTTTNNKNSNGKDVTITTINDHNKIPRVEKVVFDNRIKRKNVLALNEKVAAIREYEKRPVYKRIGRMFHCSPDQIKRIVQQKNAILNAWEQRTRKCRDAKTLEMKVVKVSMLGKAVYEWIRRMMYYKDILITDGLIQKMALQFKSAMGLQNFFPHQEWCDKFRSTYNIPTCDSKALDIGYTQSHSVQIKDVMKDVLSECSPDPEDNDDDEMDGNDGSEGEEENGMAYCENDCISIHSDEGDPKVKTKLKKKITNKYILPKASKETTTNTVQMVQHAQLQGIRQLVALPIQTNGIPGMSQKVLVATPIVQPGQKPGTTPMTMTIIPLASLAQPALSASASVATSNQQLNINNNKDQQVAVPPPILEIKKEIKEEPKDEDEFTNKPFTESVNIKKEYLTDDECEVDMQPKQSTTQLSSSLKANTPTHIVAIPLANKDMIEDSTSDSLDDLTLSSLRKRIKTEDSSTEENNVTERNLSSPPPLAAISSNTMDIPPMPPLTKAPSHNNASSSLLTHNQTPPTLSPLPNLNPARHKRLRSEDNPQTLPPIRSYGEARKYLKLLEDFALERENFRLIGLITRADEVLRELDRKENNEDEDVDID